LSDADPAGSRGVELLQETREGALPAATLPYDSGHLPQRDRQVEPIEHLASGTIPKADRLEVYVAEHAGLQADPLLGGLFSLEIEDLEEPIGGDQSVLESAVHRHDPARGTGHEARERIERHQPAGRETSV